MKQGILFFLIASNILFASATIKFSKSFPQPKDKVHFENLKDIAIDEEGSCYLLDSDLATIVKFNKDGEKIDSFKIESTNRLKNPVAVEILSNGILAVLDNDFSRVILFDVSGKYLKSFGNSSDEIGGFDSPIDMAVDENYIYIADDGNEMVLRFNYNGLFLGAIKVQGIISVDVSQNGFLHVLSKNNSQFNITVINPKLQRVRYVKLPPMMNPAHISINRFNQYYVVDSEKGSTLFLDSLGNQLTNPIGVKSSNRGRQQFNTPISVLSKSQNSQKDILFILDNKFGEVQSFEIDVDKERQELDKFTPQYKLSVMKDKLRPMVYDIFLDGDNEYLLTTNYDLIATEGENKIYSFTKSAANQNGIPFSEPIALTKFNDKLYVVDNDNNKVIVLNANDGSFSFSFGESGSGPGKFDTPSDITVDKDGNLYIADTDNNRINIFTNDGIFKSEIKTSNISPIQLAFTKDKLYILSDSGEDIYVYNLNENKIMSFNLKMKIPAAKVTSVVSLGEEYFLIYNDNDGTAYIFNDNVEYARFFSKIAGTQGLKNVDAVGFNKEKNQIVFFDNKSQQQRTVYFSIAPKTPRNLVFKVSDKGEGILSWENIGNNIAHNLILRKRTTDKVFNPLSEIDTNVYTINYKNSDEVFEYAVIAISKDGFESKPSNSVVDKYSSCLKLKETDPEGSIKKLLEIIELNPTAIKNQVINIYSKLIVVANNEKNYDAILRYYDELKKIAPDNPKFYIAQSNVYKKLLRFNEGANKLSEGIKIITDNLKMWMQLIRLQMLDKNYSGAITSCNEALKVFPDNEKLQVNLAESNAKLGKKREASQIYKSLALKKSKEDYFIKAGNLLVESNLIDDAINLYQLAENSGIEGARLFAAKGKALIEKGDYANGEFQIEKSLKLDDKNPESYYYLAQANSKKRNMRAAIEAYKKSIELDNTNADVLISYGTDLIRLRKYDDARVIFEQAVAIKPNSIEATYNLGKIYSIQKNLDLAVKYLQTANSLFPENKEIEKELKNALMAREKYNANRPPVEITVIDFDDVFPSYINYYKSQPIGDVTLFNTKNEIYDDIVLEVIAPEITKNSAIITVPIIYPNEVSENLIYMDLNDSLVQRSLDGDKEYNVTVRISYMKGDKEQKLEKKSKIKVYQLNSISWEDKKHLASFINSKDEVMRSFITSSVIAKTSPNDNRFEDVPKPILQAAQVWEYLRQMNLNYVQDPTTSYEQISQTNSIDYVQFPTQTLQIKSGDCDDLVTLLSNSLEVLGIETAYIDVPGHVFLAFNTGLSPNELEEKGISDKKVIIKFNKVWLPLESTVIGKNSFVESWDYAIKRYNKEKEGNNAVEIVEIQNAAITYPPILYPVKVTIQDSVNIDAVKKALDEDLQSFRKTRNKTYEEELLNVLNYYPTNIQTFLKLGVYYAKNKDYKNAEIYFTRVLMYDKENVTALVNLGNILYIEKDYAAADRRYRKALKYDHQNLGILANLVRCNLKLKNTKKAIEYYQQIEMIDPEYTKKIKEIRKK